MALKVTIQTIDAQLNSRLYSTLVKAKLKLKFGGEKHLNNYYLKNYK